MVVILVLAAAPWVVLAALIPYNMRTPSETDLSKSRLLAAPPAPLSQSMTLKIVTFNIHDLYLVSHDRAARTRAIGETVKDLDPDLVGFQEAWIEGDRQILLKALSGGRLAYHQYYPSGTVGSGLLIVSAYPIAEAIFHRFTKNGKWYKPWRGDWWGGKGAALARVQLPNGGTIDFYDAHAHAKYGSTEYIGVIESQMTELADFIRASATGTSPAILVGDLNCHRDTRAYKTLVERAGLTREMIIPTKIDQILAVGNARYRFEILATEPIARNITAGDHQTGLSDHTGYISTIRITPARSK